RRGREPLGRAGARRRDWHRRAGGPVARRGAGDEGGGGAAERAVELRVFQPRLPERQGRRRRVALDRRRRRRQPGGWLHRGRLRAVRGQLRHPRLPERHALLRRAGRHRQERAERDLLHPRGERAHAGRLGVVRRGLLLRPRPAARGGKPQPELRRVRGEQRGRDVLHARARPDRCRERQPPRDGVRRGRHERRARARVPAPHQLLAQDRRQRGVGRGGVAERGAEPRRRGGGVLRRDEAHAALEHRGGPDPRQPAHDRRVQRVPGVELRPAPRLPAEPERQLALRGRRLAGDARRDVAVPAVRHRPHRRRRDGDVQGARQQPAPRLPERERGARWQRAQPGARLGGGAVHRRLEHRAEHPDVVPVRELELPRPVRELPQQHGVPAQGHHARERRRGAVVAHRGRRGVPALRRRARHRRHRAALGGRRAAAGGGAARAHPHAV
ncbi:MAG: hypothetical protein AVDCRST_MAG11-4193, partial [uncultured Gemmatimonadaceae bacterium]